jgi:hypothetical protein
MPKSIFFSWVKNVYSLGIDARKNGGRVYTYMTVLIKNSLTSVHKPLFIPTFIPVFYPQLSTAENPTSPLLYRHLYPESTVPTIKPIKEK